MVGEPAAACPHELEGLVLGPQRPHVIWSLEADDHGVVAHQSPVV